MISSRKNIVKNNSSNNNNKVAEKFAITKFTASYEYISHHGTIIPTGITCKKIPCYMGDSACRWFIVKKAKIF